MFHAYAFFRIVNNRCIFLTDSIFIYLYYIFSNCNSEVRFFKKVTYGNKLNLGKEVQQGQVDVLNFLNYYESMF